MAPRAIWSGSISFGLVNVPVKLFSDEVVAKADIPGIPGPQGQGRRQGSKKAKGAKKKPARKAS